MENMESHDMRNPVNRLGIVGAVLVFLIGLLAGFLSRVPLVSVISYGLGTFCLIVLGLAYLKFTPRTVTITEDGVGFRYFQERRVFVPWSEVDAVVTDRDNSDSWIDRFHKVGYLRTIEGVCFSTTPEIAAMIREMYRQQVGTYPPGRSQKTEVVRS